MTSALHDGHASIRHPINSTLRGLPARFDYVENQISVVAANSSQLGRRDNIFFQETREKH
jgi:hypothetical protein